MYETVIIKTVFKRERFEQSYLLPSQFKTTILHNVSTRKKPSLNTSLKQKLKRWKILSGYKLRI